MGIGGRVAGHTSLEAYKRKEFGWERAPGIPDRCPVAASNPSQAMANERELASKQFTVCELQRMVVRILPTGKRWLTKDCHCNCQPSKDNLMKRNKLMIAFLFTAAFAVGCNKDGTSSQELDKVQAKTEEAARDMNDYAYAQKSVFVEKMQAQLAALNRDLIELSAKIEQSSDATKAEAEPKLQALRGQVDKLNQQLDQAKNATESTWDNVKAASKKAYNELKDGVQHARQWVSDKIAP
jgi:hypothetical protein